ncbi:sigma-70 family RNA polymerase sigma factor [Paenisporosarcina sp.]|uniref:sigma-70 family RNA polymerase sigma factor n=1 Tax=Paenisporosarcina sp. TaxID=1932001 RepID=UPI003C76F37A
MKQINLVLNAIKGDEHSFETLITQESDKLYKIAMLHVRNKEDALDVIQDTVYKAFISIGQLKNPEFFSTWLVKILMRSCYSLLKKKKKTLLPGEMALSGMLESVNQKVELDVDLPHALSKLEPHYQTVIILFYFHDLSIQSIAESLEKPEGTIKTYLRRARIELKKVIEGGNIYEQRLV